MNTLLKFAFQTLGLSVAAILFWLAVIPERIKRALLARDKQGVVFFLPSLVLIAMGIMSALRVFSLTTLEGSQSLNGLLAIWAVTFGGFGATYGFLVLLPDRITDRMYSNRYEWVYLLIAIVLIILMIFL